MILGVFLAEHTEERSHRWPLISLSCPSCSTPSSPAKGSIWCVRVVRLVAQELIGAELLCRHQAARYERTEDRSNERNGHRTRLLRHQGR